MCFFFCDVCFAFHCSYCIFVNYFFFFFKQKTAYEMRISDWSSDVCSSDLPINATCSPILSVFPSLSDLVRIAVIGPELTDIFLLAARGPSDGQGRGRRRSEEHTSELQSLMRISYAVFCLKKKKKNKNIQYLLIHIINKSTEICISYM